MTKELPALLIVCLATSSIALAAQDVTTIAGSGAAGIADGPAQKATFLFPAGVAVAHDGSIYISDSAAQRIRLLTTDGQVRTVAGSGVVAQPGLIVPPGYQDGPALQAKFNGPSGLAIGPDGALYIADSYNGCIRKLSGGQVSTVLGKCSENGLALRRSPGTAVDGPVDAARFVHPSAIAFDAAGVMYVADDGGGLRRFQNGVVTTIHFAEEGRVPRKEEALSAVGLAIGGTTDQTIAVSTHDFLFVYHPSTGQDEIIYPNRPTDAGNPFGHPNQLAALDARQFLFTDLMSSNVRFMRIESLPFNGSQLTRVIAGGRFERPTDNAGFANGSSLDARFYDPGGIAIAGNRAIIADGGNRRVRQIVLPAFRSSESGLDPANHVDGRHYEVALVGASWTFWDTIGYDSICAHIEDVLNASHRFRKPVRCHTVRVDAGRVDAFEDYIKNVFPYEHMDLAIIDAEGYAHDLPGGRGNEDRTLKPLPGNPNTTFAAYFRTHIAGLLDFLRPLKTRLALLWIYNAQDTSDAEWIVQGSGFYRAPPSTSVHEAYVQTAGALKNMRIVQYDTYEDVVRYELRADAAPLYQPFDQHPNPRGNAFLGDHIAEGLLKAGLGKP